MACRICDHTMEYQGTMADKGKSYWCPRCGTTLFRWDDEEIWEAPRLVERVRALLDNQDPEKFQGLIANLRESVTP